MLPKNSIKGIFIIRLLDHHSKKHTHVLPLTQVLSPSHWDDSKESESKILLIQLFNYFNYKSFDNVVTEGTYFFKRCQYYYCYSPNSSSSLKKDGNPVDFMIAIGNDRADEFMFGKN